MPGGVRGVAPRGVPPIPILGHSLPKGRAASMASLLGSTTLRRKKVGREHAVVEPVNRLAVGLAVGVVHGGKRSLAHSCSACDCDHPELPVREHRAMAPSHGFAAASHREAALRGAPASHSETAFRGAAGFREARRRHAVHPSRNAVLRRRAGRTLSGREARRHAGGELRPGDRVDGEKDRRAEFHCWPLARCPPQS
jgi:hypothetical protein